MSDDKPKSIKLRIVKDGSVVKVDWGNGFHARVQQLLFYILSKEPPERTLLALENIKTKEPADDFEYHVLTLLTAIYAGEAAFEKGACLEDREVPIPAQTN